MAKSARCSRCDLDLPYDKSKCPACGLETYINEDDDYDPQWKEKVKAIQNRWEPGKPLPNVSTGKMIQFKGNLFVSNDLLRRYGYLNVETDSVVLIGGKYYEVNGAINDDDAPGWWITEVNPEKESADFPYPTLSVYEYTQLQKARIRGWTDDPEGSP